MPSLKEAISTALPNYVPATPQPPVAPILPHFNQQNRYLRCILPPFNADVDSLRQFDNGSSSPKTRVMPLPGHSTIGGKTTITNNITSSSSSSGSGTGAVVLLPLSVFLTTTLLPVGSVYTGSIALSQSFQLISVSTTAPCEVRLYGTALAQAHDASRNADDPVAPEISSNIISCVNLDTSPYIWNFQNRVGANQDSPQGTAIYVTVINTDPSLAEAVTVTLVYVPLET